MAAPNPQKQIQDAYQALSYLQTQLGSKPEIPIALTIYLDNAINIATTHVSSYNRQLLPSKSDSIQTKLAKLQAGLQAIAQQNKWQLTTYEKPIPPNPEVAPPLPEITLPESETIMPEVKVGNKALPIGQELSVGPEGTTFQHPSIPETGPSVIKSGPGGNFTATALSGLGKVAHMVTSRIPGASATANIVNRALSGNPKDIFLAGGAGLALLAGGPLGAGIFLLVFSSRFRRDFFRVLLSRLYLFFAAIFATLAAIGVFTALVLFIINSGAYVVPPGESLLNLVGLQEGAPSTSTGPGGAWPNCWPTIGWITQGPGGILSHSSVEAIDISEGLDIPVYATHDGVASVYYGDPIYGNHVIITSPEGFSTVYGHFNEVYVGSGPITAGALLGGQGCTGSTWVSGGKPGCGIHLHYELRNSMGILINQIVPQYTVGGYTTGCFAKDSGGSGEPPTPNTSCTKAYGICTSNCPSSSQILTPPPGGWTDCSQICCQSEVPPGEGTLCTTSGGECSSTNCFPDPVIPLPGGQSAWPDCTSDSPICCQTEPVETCISQGATCRSTCHPDCIREFSGCTTQLCCDNDCTLLKPPPEPTTAICSSEGGYCDSTCISGVEVELPAGVSTWSDCSSQKPLCCKGGIPVGYIP